jgi:DNA repair and recombination protein RAD52
MAGSFSSHLIDSFLSTQQQSRGPFGQHMPAQPEIATYGPMAFAPSMHGTFATNLARPSALFNADPIYMNLSEENAMKIATLQAKLNKKLGPEFVSQRPGPGGGPKLTYAEGWKIINLANEVFGFNGWSSTVVNLATDFIDCNEETKRFNVGVTAIVRVTLRDGVFHEDIGYGLLENSKSKGSALDKVRLVNSACYWRPLRPRPRAQL